jgi:predicted esterase
MRKQIQIKTPDNYIIYGTLDSDNNQTLLIFVHGITGNQDEHHYFNAVPFFTKNGFDTFRFDLYSDKDGARSLSESTIMGHSKDLELIINNFKDKYKKIILIGHSLGAPVILKTNLSSISKIVLWDPTTGFKKIEDQEGEYCQEIDKYILHWGMDIIIGKQMVEEWKSLNIDKLIENLTIPCKFIFAGNHNKHELWKPFLNKIKVKNKSVIVEGATHCFVEEGTEQKLFEETLKWIK